mmetsp:Transcript_54100/g.125840  ORF Transcript_54100/g.125840 Transcript_54100/m.125840 type:complete len:114 (+) Transcript_54100:83-424(+)|eukprot:CAMPEP_0171092560 /NCGR_PEP_ID=MMETSP0766_2-20121228/36099_1 /TAXON_ID=439317 /ORGANISM="Gambierdiscus australes, Strain CAWD 149" /LENGTH=113 /DNA_ID=CAMNT_0011550825 /DNA_START=83 /DNA_END=424 /DNA_ORIENTATION=-
MTSARGWAGLQDAAAAAATAKAAAAKQRERLRELQTGPVSPQNEAGRLRSIAAQAREAVRGVASAEESARLQRLLGVVGSSRPAPRGQAGSCLAEEAPMAEANSEDEDWILLP